MDFWFRLLGGGVPTVDNKDRVTRSETSAERLVIFKKECKPALRLWNEALIRKPTIAIIDQVQASLCSLIALLNKDVRAPPPHLCISFVVSTSFFKAVTRVALALNNNAIIRETVRFFAALVECDEESPTASKKFGGTVLKLFDHILYTRPRIIDQDTEAELLELMFNVAASLRMHPDFLPAWFTSAVPPRSSTDSVDLRRQDDETDLPITDESEAVKTDFSLCRQFLHCVHLEGKAGDFARMGILYLFEAAGEAPLLNLWICQSDLPLIMASGLGALYSQLSRTLEISLPSENLPFLLALSDDGYQASPHDIENAYSSETSEKLSSFLAYVNFWQDVLEHCRSEAIIADLLKNFEHIFLQQLFFPSILQSADADVPSVVAMLTYCWRILETINRPPLAEPLLTCLCGAPTISETSKPRYSFSEGGRFGPDSQPCSSSALKSLASAGVVDFQGLLQTSLCSSNIETIIAALRVIVTLLSQQHIYTISSMITRSSSILPTNASSLGTLTASLQTLLGFARNITEKFDIDEDYENCIKDALNMMESHSCWESQSGIDIHALSSTVSSDHEHGLSQFNGLGHYIDMDAPLFQALIHLLTSFFTNDPRVNIGLTSIIAHLVSCCQVRVERWLIPVDAPPISTAAEVSIHDQITPPKSSFLHDEQSRLRGFVESNQPRLAARPEHVESTLLRILRVLVHELGSVKPQIVGFDSLLVGRKRAFQGEAEARENDAHDDLAKFQSANTRSKTVTMLPVTPKGGRSRASTTTTTVQTQTQITQPQTPNRPTQTGEGNSSPFWRLFGGSPASRRHSKSMVHGQEATATSSMAAAAGAVEALSMSLDGAADRTLTVHSTLTASTEYDQPVSAPVATDPLKHNVRLPSLQSLEEEMPEDRITSLSMLLSNAIILQSFMLELAALMHVRAGILKDEWAIA